MSGASNIIGPDTEGVSLGRAFERYSGRSYGGSHRWSTILATWDALVTDVLEPASKFISTLLPQQEHTLVVLMAWWSAAYDTLHTVNSIQATLRMLAVDSQEDPNAVQALDADLLGDYHGSLLAAFKDEFWDLFPYARQEDLIWSRKEASISTACQRVAYHTSLLYLNHPEFEQEWLENRVTPVSGFAKKLSRMSQKFRDLQLNPVLRACPWIPSEKRKGLPYYLYDIDDKTTVVVHELPSPPLYTVVSHTWGRWRIPGVEVWVPGVDWKVPVTQKFDLGELLQNLQKQRLAGSITRYIWFDLFCIPQDPTDPERAALGSREIARQAAIFGAASRAVAWINDIEDWTGLRWAIHWYAVSYLGTSPQNRPATKYLRSLIESKAPENAGVLLQIAKERHSNGVPFEDYEPCPWFSSLWTLQECGLRPDIAFVNHDWQPLTLEGSPDGLICSLDLVISLMRNSDPQGVTKVRVAHELLTLMERSGLLDLLDATPTAFLVLGTRRYCSSRRAEAIMSVVGATDWYDKAERTTLEDNLIVGTFPIEFLREVKDREGANFFCSEDLNRSPYWDIWDSKEDIGCPAQARVAGTLLPFLSSTGPWKHVGMPTLVQDRHYDHHTISSWILKDDGKVYIPAAAIVASTQESLDEGTDQELHVEAPNVSPAGPPKLTKATLTNLHDFLRTGLARLIGKKHAIMIFRGPPFTEYGHGVILLEVPGLNTGIEVYAKLCAFDYIYPEKVPPQVCQVAWEVL